MSKYRYYSNEHEHSIVPIAGRCKRHEMVS